MKKLTNAQMATLEIALMGAVVSCDETEVDLVSATRYILSAVNGKYNFTEDELTEKAEDAVKRIHKYDSEDEKTVVRFISVNTSVLDDSIHITYILDTGDEYSPCNFKAVKKLVEDPSREAGGAYYWFSYVYNVTCPEFSEVGDTFYAKDPVRNWVQRVS